MIATDRLRTPLIFTADFTKHPIRFRFLGSFVRTFLKFRLGISKLTTTPKKSRNHWYTRTYNNTFKLQGTVSMQTMRFLGLGDSKKEPSFALPSTDTKAMLHWKSACPANPDSAGTNACLSTRCPAFLNTRHQKKGTQCNPNITPV